MDEKDKDDLPMGGIVGYSAATGAPVFVPSGNKVMSDLNWLLPGLNTRVKCPHCKDQVQRVNLAHPISDGPVEWHDHTWRVHPKQTVSEIVIHLNDQCGWTREQVADWLDTLDVDLTFPTELPPRPVSSDDCGCSACTAQMKYPGSGPTISFTSDDPLPSGDVEISGHGYAKQSVSYPPVQNDWPSVTWTMFSKLGDGDGDWETLGELTAVNPPTVYFLGAHKSGKQSLETSLFTDLKDVEFSVAIDPAKLKEIFGGFTTVALSVGKGLKKMSTVVLDSFSKLQAYQVDEILDYYGKQATWLTADGAVDTPSDPVPLPPDPKTQPFTASTLQTTDQLVKSLVAKSSVFPDGLSIPLSSSALNLAAPKSYPTAKEKFSHGNKH